jgi:hypothetical protein
MEATVAATVRDVVRAEARSIRHIVRSKPSSKGSGQDVPYRADIRLGPLAS